MPRGKTTKKDQPRKPGGKFAEKPKRPEDYRLPPHLSALRHVTTKPQAEDKDHPNPQLLAGLRALVLDRPDAFIELCRKAEATYEEGLRKRHADRLGSVGKFSNSPAGGEVDADPKTLDLKAMAEKLLEECKE